MSPAARSKSKDKKAAKESQKASKSSVSGNGNNGAAASAYNPVSGTFHALEMLSATSASGVQTNGRFRNIDETDEHAGGCQTAGLDYDAVSNNGSWSGESEDHKEKVSSTPTRVEVIPGSDNNDKREKNRLKNERKHQRQRERRAQELHERCRSYLMSRKLEALAQQIVQMGFPHERATAALILNEGRVIEAVSWLIEGGEDGEACKDTNVHGGNLKIDISDELAQIADLETRYNISKQEVERAVVHFEGDLEKAAESWRRLRHDTPPSAPSKPEETGDPPTVSNGKLSVASQNSRPQVKVNVSPNQHKKDERDFNYVKGVVTPASSVDPVNKHGQIVKRIQSRMDWPKPQQSTGLADKKWTAAGANPSVTHSSASLLQVSVSLGKTEKTYISAGDYKSPPSASVREPVIMMQRPQSVSAKQHPASSMSTSPPATAGNWYPTNGIEIVKPNGFIPQIPSSKGSSLNYLTTNQMYQQFQYQPQQQFIPGSSPGEPQGNSLRSKTSSGPPIAPASSLGLFAGLGSTGSSGASSPVDWSTAGSMPHFDYSNIDWSLDRGMSLPRSTMLIGLSPLTKNTAHVYDSDTTGVGVHPSMRSLPSNVSIHHAVSGLQDSGVASSETSDAAGTSREWSSPFEGKDLFSLPRQFVSSPSL